MKKSTVAIWVLAASLVASNAWWVFRTLDSGITSTYQKAQLEEEQQASNQAIAIIRAVAIPNATQAQIVEAARKEWPAPEPFEKDGHIWVGRLGLKFDDQGKLKDVIR